MLGPAAEYRMYMHVYTATVVRGGTGSKNRVAETVRHLANGRLINALINLVAYRTRTRNRVVFLTKCLKCSVPVSRKRRSDLFCFCLLYFRLE